MTPAELLAIEARFPRHTTAKENALRRVGLSPVRYYQLLIRAAESLDGIGADPLTARRVRERTGRRVAS